VPKRKERSERETVVNEDAVSLNSFHAYESSDDDETKVVDGKPVVADFHMYDSKNKKNRKWLNITFFFAKINCFVVLTILLC